MSEVDMFVKQAWSELDWWTKGVLRGVCAKAVLWAVVFGVRRLSRYHKVCSIETLFHLFFPNAVIFENSNKLALSLNGNYVTCIASSTGTSSHQSRHSFEPSVSFIAENPLYVSSPLPSSSRFKLQCPCLESFLPGAMVLLSALELTYVLSLPFHSCHHDLCELSDEIVCDG